MISTESHILPLPSDLRTPTRDEINHAAHMTSLLAERCLSVGASRWVRIDQSTYGGLPSIAISMAATYHVIPILLPSSISHRRCGWRAERLFNDPGNEDYGEQAADFFAPLTPSGSLESAVAAVFLDIHSFWISDALDAYLMSETLVDAP